MKRLPKGNLALIATMRSPRCRSAVVALVAPVLVLAACSSSSSGTTLNGSGSTFQQSFDQLAEPTPIDLSVAI